MMRIDFLPMSKIENVLLLLLCPNIGRIKRGLLTCQSHQRPSRIWFPNLAKKSRGQCPLGHSFYYSREVFGEFLLLTFQLECRVTVGHLAKGVKLA